jgi:hypothetical protein
MADQNLLTFFIAITTLAVLIQTGIVAGLFFASLKMSKQADRAAVEFRRLLDPLHRLVDAMETASVRVSEFSASSQGNLRQVEARWAEVLEKLRQKIA